MESYSETIKTQGSYKVKNLIDQSNSIRTWYPFYKKDVSNYNFRGSIAYPSSFGKTTLLKFLEAYHNKNETDLKTNYGNWSLAQERL